MAGSSRGQDEANPVFWLATKPIRIVRFDPLASKKSHGATYKVRNFLTMSSMESPKTTEDIQNKENINELEDAPK